jgi:hypothetical protein
MNPCRDDIGRGGVPDREVLAPRRPREPGAADPLIAERSVRADVGEGVGTGHVLGVTLRGDREGRVGPQRRDLRPLTV